MNQRRSNRTMNILRPLSPHLPIYKPQLTSTFPISHRISGAFLATIVFFFYLLCLFLGSLDFFQPLLSKVGSSVGGRALSLALSKLGCSGGLSLAIGFAVRAILTAEIAPQMMMGDPAGTESGASGASSSDSWQKYLNLPSDSEESATHELSTSSSWSGSWIQRWLSPEVSSSAPNERAQEASTAISSQPAENQPGGLPAANPEAAPPQLIQPNPPGQQTPIQEHLGDHLSPEDRAHIVHRINMRLLLAAEKKTGWQPPMEKIDTLIKLKSQVIDRMGELDPHPFWVEEQSRKNLLADSIRTKSDWEYNPVTLDKKLRQLTQHGKNCSFYNELFKLREDGEP